LQLLWELQEPKSIWQTRNGCSSCKEGFTHHRPCKPKRKKLPTILFGPDTQRILQANRTTQSKRWLGEVESCNKGSTFRKTGVKTRQVRVQLQRVVRGARTWPSKGMPMQLHQGNTNKQPLWFPISLPSLPTYPLESTQEGRFNILSHTPDRYFLQTNFKFKASRTVTLLPYL